MRPLRTTPGRRTGRGLTGGPSITDQLRAAALAVTKPVTLRLTSTRGPPGGKGRSSGTLRGPSLKTRLRQAAVQIAQPITLRLTSTTGPPRQQHTAAFRAAVRELRRVQRFIRQTERLAQLAEQEATRRGLKPIRRSPFTSRAALWRWYRATGRSWAQFIADHGPG